MSCPDCFKGSVHDEQPRGQMIKLHGLDTYVSEPTDGRAPKGIIVIIPDAFGLEFVNNKILADHYAAKGGYKVYLPDFMNGHSCPVWVLESMQQAMTAPSILTKIYNGFWAVCGFLPFVFRNAGLKRWSVVKGFFEQLRKEEGESLPVGAAGFCWGGKHTLLLAHGAEIDGRSLIDAGFTGHPSMLKLPSDIDKIALPVSFALASDDNQISPEQGKQIQAIVEGKADGAKGEVKIYEGASHGFCVRADMKLKEIAKQAADSEDQCLEWFDKQLKPRQ